MLIVALVIVFVIGFLLYYNIRIALRILSITDLRPTDMVQAVLVGAGAAFLFYYFT
jgi:hypothetical protein